MAIKIIEESSKRCYEIESLTDLHNKVMQLNRDILLDDSSFYNQASYDRIMAELFNAEQIPFGNITKYKIPIDLEIWPINDEVYGATYEIKIMQNGYYMEPFLA